MKSTIANYGSPLKGHALFNYKAREDDEISFHKGESLQVLETYDDGWWMVSKNNIEHVGLAPSNYIRLNDEKNIEAENAELPADWKSAIDKDSNDIYYYNESTGEAAYFFI